MLRFGYLIILDILFWLFCHRTIQDHTEYVIYAVAGIIDDCD